MSYQRGEPRPCWRCERCGNWKRRRFGLIPPPCPNCSNLRYRKRWVFMVQAMRVPPTEEEM